MKNANKKGGNWTTGTVNAILKNEKYTGDVYFQKTYTDDRFTSMHFPAWCSARIAVTFTDALPGTIEANIPRYGVAALELSTAPADALQRQSWKRIFKGQQ